MAGYYTINRAAVAKLLYGKTPSNDMVPIYPELERRAKAVEHRAKVLVPKRTGRTAASINTTGSILPPFIWFRIEAHTRYAYYLHRGTKPHIIMGHLGGEMSFRKGGRMIHTRVVHHPGTKPHPYLKDALPDFWRAHESAVFSARDAATVAFTKGL
jgi:hypothetical protein